MDTTAKAIELIQQGLYRDAAVLLASKVEEPLTSADCVVKHLLKYAVSTTEYFIVVTVDSGSNLINVHEVAKGNGNCVLVHPREVFRTAIMDNAVGIILAHNHPGGSMKPSDGDIELTKRMIDAGDVLKIPILDHIIVSGNEWISIKEMSESN